MLDHAKTEILKERLNELRSSEEEKIDAKKDQLPNMFLFILAARIVFFYFTQVFIMEKAGITPFTWWETPIIFFGLGAAISLFKKTP